MTTALQLRRGTTAQHGVFTGTQGEVTVDTDKKTVVVHDGVTQGGTPLAREDSLTKFVRHDTDEQGLTVFQKGYACTNIGLGNVDNTSDADKPISTATQAALDEKLGAVGGQMSGPLLLVSNATQHLQAVPKQQMEAYVTSSIEEAGQAYIGHGMQRFTASGVFTVPEGITAIKVRGCGGGGGGGGTTSFGAYCTATGGSGGNGGTASGGDINLTGGKAGSYTSGSYTYKSGGVCGSGGVASAGSAIGILGGSCGVDNAGGGASATGYGNGGTTGTLTTTAYGAGGYFERYITGFAGGEEIIVTVGAAGTSGSPGICIVEW